MAYDTNKTSLRGTKQSHDTTLNNKQITLAKKPRKDVPKLRFNEFEGEWEQKKLGAVTEMTSSKRVYLSDYVNNGVPFYRGKEISELRLNKTPSDILYITRERYEDFKKKYGVPLKDDILITAVGTLGNVLRIRNDDEFYFKDGNLIWLKNIKVDSVFLETLIQWKNNDLLKTSIGSTQKALTMVELRKLKFTFPKLPEQQKIASFLTAVDTKLQQLTTKKEKLSQYKKGAMQQLFSQQLRFKPDVTNTTVIARTQDKAISPNEAQFPDWEEKKLGEVCKVNPKNSELPNSFVYIDLESVEKGILVKENEIDLKEAPSRAQRKLQINDILFQTVRPYQMNNLYFNKEGDYIASTGYAQLRTKENSMFLFQLIHTHHFVSKVLKRCTGTSYPAINSNDLAKIKIKTPSLKEQQKIANFLSAVDTKIAGVQTQITNTQAFKKGLLQQLFV